MDEDDDEMIVIIIGDEDKDIPLPFSIKNEPEESKLNAKSILETAELYGERISLIKEEYDDYEYLEDTEETELQLKKQPIKEYDNKKASGNIVKKVIEPKKRRVESISSDSDDEDSVPPENQISYVAQLRKNFPRFRKDEKYLVSHLADVMKNTKAPSPPIDFCLTDGGRLVCAYCGTESSNLPNACRHYQKKHGSRIFVCFACGSNYRCTTGLYKHEKRCNAPGADLVLKARGQYLGRKGRHRPFLTHNKFDPGGLKAKEPPATRHFCSLCTASFRHKEALQAHEYMHRGLRPYQCEKCPMAYTSIVALRRHLRSHTGAQYICDTCDRSFKAKGTLIVHMNRHLPQRKYPCEHCERRFAQQSALKAHVDRDHLNIPPPFACAACPKRFPRMSNLKAHMKARHGLTVMTRRMFFKALPSMKETEELKQATIVFNQSEFTVRDAQQCIAIENVPIDDTPTITVETDHEEAEKDNTIENFLTTFDGDCTPEIEYNQDDLSVKNGNEDEILGIVEVLNSNGMQKDNNLYYEDANRKIKVKEDVIYTPKKPVVKTSIPESCELEFMRFITKRGECNTVKTNIKTNKKSRAAKIDLSKARPNRNKNNMDMPVLIDDINDNPPVNINDNTNYIVVHENARDIEIRMKTDNQSEIKPIIQRTIVNKKSKRCKDS